MPNVGMGNQMLTLTSYLAHALVTGRALFLLDTHLQCRDDEWGDVPQSAGSDLSFLCGSFRLRHEAQAAGGADPVPLWRLGPVLERARANGRLHRFHAAYPEGRRLHLYFRPNPEHQQAIERFVCAADVPPRDGAAPKASDDAAALLVVQTTQYYVPLLQANPRLMQRLRRLFVPVDHDAWAPHPPARGRPFEADLDVFGPLFRFLIAPSAEVEVQVEAFAARHFASAARVIGVHLRGGIPGADNTWVNAFGRGQQSLSNFERAARLCARRVAVNATRAATEVLTSADLR